MFIKSSSEIENVCWQNGQLVLGLDEVGVGCLAGPLVVAGVILKPGFDDPRIGDSKMLSAKKRELLSKIILENSVKVFIKEIPVRDIEKYNVRQAGIRAMKDIATKATNADKILVDYYDIKDTRVTSFVKGELKSISIAAASIVAKVYRDNLMKQLSITFPNYLWENNKGYGTKAHYEAIAKYGATLHHRKNYRLV